MGLVSQAGLSRPGATAPGQGPRVLRQLVKIEYLADITPYHIKQLRTWLKSRTIKVGDTEKELTRSRATINRYMQLLRGMFYKAIDWKIYSRPNPVSSSIGNG